MCGISLICSPENPALLRAVGDMSDLISHRGPDDEGYVFFSSRRGIVPKVCGGRDTSWSAKGARLPYAPQEDISRAAVGDYHLAMGHRRLSIIDLSGKGHQPMCDSERRYWIVYNGEIYNYLELKKELERLGSRFYTSSDTEVVLNSYIVWGEDCLRRFNGMFAFAVFDNKLKKLFVARDRFGIKPLYYWESPTGFWAIASEIKQFTPLSGWEARLNHQEAYDFLNWGVKNHRAETFFVGVTQLPGGYCFSRFLSEKGNIAARQWYKLPFRPFSGSLSRASGKFRDLLRDSVRLRCRSDVAVGSCLSGGLDSSSIVCLMNGILEERGCSRSQSTFSACSTHKRFDESAYIADVVGKTGVSGTLIYPQLEDLMADMEDLVWYQEEPFGSTSIFAQWAVFKAAGRQEVKVMLDGQGADEQLGGYSGFLAARFLDLFTSFRFLTLFRETRKHEMLFDIAAPCRMILNRLLPDPIKQPLRKLFHKPTLRCPWLNLAEIEERDPHRPTRGAKGSFQSQSLAQITGTSLPALLHYEDRNSMAHSVEARTPFLDYRLVEFVYGLPVDYKIGDGVTKRVLRLGLSDLLPPKVRDRRDKLGFVTPEEIWVRDQAPYVFKQLSREAVRDSRGILNDKAIDHGDKMIDGRIPFDFSLWRRIAFGKWMKRFAVSP